MGDISRHRDIYFHIREITPEDLLGKCRLSKGELTYLELGNYLTDVSQFRDPVSYIFSKQRIWREKVIPKVSDKVSALRALSVLAGAASLAAGEIIKSNNSGVPAQVSKYAEPTLAGLGGLIAIIPTDTYAGVANADDWIDKMFGIPAEQSAGTGAAKDEHHYGLVGEFFRSFINGITQLLFADNVQNKVKGDWGNLDRIPSNKVTDIFKGFYTQYFPHEHTDQPPYVWDASKRPQYPHWYAPSKRGRTLKSLDVGVMNAVDDHYIQYLSENLSAVESEWLKLKPQDNDGRRRMLVRMGKLCHGIEDWYFHSNIVELIRLRGFRPVQVSGESDEGFLQRFVDAIAKTEPEFVNAGPVEQLRLKRILFRRLRFPFYEKGTKANSAGIISNKQPSTLSLHHAYPAFPSQQDTSHTLMHALENLEFKVTHPSTKTPPSSLPPWVPAIIRRLATASGGDGQKLIEEKAKARGVSAATILSASLFPQSQQRDTVTAVILDVLREWLPLVVTLLAETERQRLIANKDPLLWDLNAGAVPAPTNGPTDSETNKQLDRHTKALKRAKNDEGFTENNYERATRYLLADGFINSDGRDAIVHAFEIDARSQKLLKDAPGCGGFLMQFSLELQKVLDESDAAVEKLNKNKNSVYDKSSFNDSVNEIIGSHSLMSKDTLKSPPFFDDAKVIASVASSSVFRMMLQVIGTPVAGRRMPWKAVLHYFIRYPVNDGGWERRAIDFFKKNNRIPKYEELPELDRFATSAFASPEAQQPFVKPTKDEELKERYTKLELELSQYRYP